MGCSEDRKSVEIPFIELLNVHCQTVVVTVQCSHLSV